MSKKKNPYCGWRRKKRKFNLLNCLGLRFGEDNIREDGGRIVFFHVI